MPASKAKVKANAKYTAKTYDKILTYVHKGKKEALQAHAATKDESLNGFMNRAINETLERDMVLANVTKDEKETMQAHVAAKDESLNDFVNRAIIETLERDKSGVSQPAEDIHESK